MSWLQPTAVVCIILFIQRLQFNSLDSSLNKRIDDLRNQMTREHDILAQKVDKINEKLDAHINDRNLHN